MKGERVQCLIADLFQAPDDYALAHAVGADLKMGRGVATEFKRLFGNQTFLLEQAKSAGEVAVLPGTRCGRAAPIFYLVTKPYSSDFGPTWEHFVSCLRELKSLCLQMGIKHIAMPKIGCGEDHLPWSAVEEQLYSIFMGSDVSVFVFCPVVLPQSRSSLPCLPGGEPVYKGFQLMGDSQGLRFALNFGRYDQSQHQLYPKQLGLCISGQRMKSLHFNLSLTKDTLRDNVIVFIGTNDVLHASRHKCWRRDIALTLRATFFQLSKFLSRRCSRVIFVSVPSVPACPESQQDVTLINSLFKKCCRVYKNIRVVHCQELQFMDGGINLSLFESFMGFGDSRRPDGIHLNLAGFKLLKLRLDDVISSF